MSSRTRNKHKAIGGLSSIEKEKMAEHAKIWINRIMRTRQIDQNLIKKGIRGLYTVAGLKEPRVVVVSSPLVMAFAYGAASAIWHSREKNLDSATRRATYAATDAATRRATDAATYDATDFATYAPTDAATRRATDAVHGAGMACYELSGEFGLVCADRWTSVYQGGAYWASWDCFLTAFRDILGLNLNEYKKYYWWELCAIESSFRVMHEKFCIVSDFPEILKVDDRNLPHCENGPSHRWRDGWELYHWHGVSVPREWILKQPNINDALKHENVELRRVASEILGWDKVLSSLNPQTIDKDSDEMIGELLEVELPDVGVERFLKVKCGTGRIFVLPVPREMQTALQANAWSYAVDESVIEALEERT